MRVMRETNTMTTMGTTQAVSEAKLPAPETLIDQGDGYVTALMFYYTPEGVSLREVASLWGFDCMVYHLDDPDLQEEYDEGATDIMSRWTPVVPEGWLLGAKLDLEEDGPAAIFIKKR
jgi:hypothetical protein